MAGDDEIEVGNRDEQQLHYDSANLPSDWPFNASNDVTNTSMSMVSGPTIWDHHPTDSPNLGAFCDMNMQNNATTCSSSLGFRKGNLADVYWAPPNLAAAAAMLPHSLSQFPADSGFIERAARFSAGSFGNPPESSLSPYSSRTVQGKLKEGFVGNGFKLASGDGSKDGSQLKQGGSGFSGNSSECGGLDENSDEGVASRKRKRNDQVTEYNEAKRSPNEAIKNKDEIQEKGDNEPNKSNGKQVSDAQKQEYIHVRARRGQATNSHSLAERVRREKISERMKFLQDLVPGCSKVTGKAVMLDEIINYVQSLQQQVEFLSMKLATVNPRMELNLEGLLAKHMLESRRGASDPLGFGPEITRPSFTHNSSQMAIVHGGSSLDAVRRTVNSHLMAFGGGYKDHTSNVPSLLDDELHNIVQMGLNPNTPITNQNLESTPPGHLKAGP